jgi:FAD:protein FMN transferase
MTIPYCVQVGERLSEKQKCAVHQKILETFAEVHAVYNNWNPDSEVAMLGKLGAYRSVTLSESLAAFLTFVGELVSRTEGRFDPTVEPLQHIWKEYLHLSTLPPQSQLEPLMHALGWHHVHFEGRIFWKDEALTAIDFGGVAKGYAVDLIVTRLAQDGYQSVYAEWGGEIRTLGHHPSGRPWKVGIYGLYPIELNNEAVATSGSYIQNWTIDGICYTHLIDPRVGEPLHDNPISSVSVIAPTCAEADALATALMLFPSSSAAMDWASSHGIRAYIW